MDALLFTYGTLRRGCLRGSFLDRTAELWEGVIRVDGFEMRSVGGFFPIAIPSPRRTLIGDLWRIDDRLFSTLDQIETDMYVRRQIDHGAGRLWIYVAASPDMARRYPEIQSGDWLAHCGQPVADVL